MPVAAEFAANGERLGGNRHGCGGCNMGQVRDSDRPDANRRDPRQAAAGKPAVR
jgi:hypothetical protein